MSNDRWQDEFFKRKPGGDAATPTESVKDAALDEFDLLPGVDTNAYKAFIVQRGRSVSMFLDLRTFDARSGVLQGTMLSYPQLVAVDYVDDHTILLDFGMRHVRIEGERLAELIQRLHSASISVIQAWSPKIWGEKEPEGAAIVRRITHLGLGQGH